MMTRKAKDLTTYAELHREGRCDLLPLSEIAAVLEDPVLDFIGSFMMTGDTDYIHKAITQFCTDTRYYNRVPCYDVLIELSMHAEDLAKEYGERKWEEGVPCHCFIDCGVRHYIRHCNDWTDCGHGIAFLWNMYCLLWMLKNRPDMNALPHRPTDTQAH